MAEWIDAVRQALTMGVYNQIEAEPRRGFVAKPDHLAKFPGRVDMQNRKRQLGRKERLTRKVQQDGRILANGIEQHRLAELRQNFAEICRSLPPPGVANPQASLYRPSSLDLISATYRRRSNLRIADGYGATIATALRVKFRPRVRA